MNEREELIEDLTWIRQRARNCRGAIESGQIVDKDVRGSLLKVTERLDALIERLRTGTVAQTGKVPVGDFYLVPREIIDQFPEINVNNYDHDDACALNAWGCEVVTNANPAGSPALPSTDREAGFFANLTPEQQKSALEYDGPENHGDAAVIPTERAWNPIDSAPKDGSIIEIRYVTDDPRRVRWSHSQFGTYWHLSDGHGPAIIRFEPTEWRPALTSTNGDGAAS